MARYPRDPNDRMNTEGGGASNLPRYDMVTPEESDTPRRRMVGVPARKKKKAIRRSQASKWPGGN